MQRSNRSRLLAAVTAAALLVPVAAHAHGPARARGPLTDLQTSVSDATDGARAAVMAVHTRHGTLMILHVRGIDRAIAGTTLGSHLHTGPCVEGDGASAGPHFNIEAHQGSPTPTASPDTEVWLDFRVRRNGTGHAFTHVPFRVPDGAARSVVVHALPTAPGGAAGPRLACIAIDL